MPIDKINSIVINLFSSMFLQRTSEIIREKKSLNISCNTFLKKAINKYVMINFYVVLY